MIHYRTNYRYWRARCLRERNQYGLAFGNHYNAAYFLREYAAHCRERY